MTNEDAWKQLVELYEKYTKEWLVRDDLRVRALGTGRAVELGLGQMKRNPKFNVDMMDFRITQRNVSTMRELADALVEACDFVEQSNPIWASQGKENPMGDVSDVTAEDAEAIVSDEIENSDVE